MKKISFAILLFSSLSAFTQNVTKEDIEKETKPLIEKLTILQTENQSLKREIGNLNNKLKNFSLKLDSLKKQTDANNNAIAQSNSELDIKIQETGKSIEEKTTAIGKSLSKKSLFGIIGVLTALLLSGLIYLLLSNRQKNNKSVIEGQLSQTKKSIEEEQIQINTKLAELYNGQMELLKSERKASPNNGEIDHSLPLKVADEIVKMQMNLAHMDSKIKGHRHLSIAVTNVFDNFKANGYEIIDHLNKPYNDGMNMQATKELDPSLKNGEQFIRRIIKPEIHFNNKIIQHAQVIVAYGELQN